VTSPNEHSPSWASPTNRTPTELDQALDQGKVTLGTVGLDPTATAAQPAAAPTSVTVADCVNDEKWLLYHKSGGLVDNVPGGRHRTTATVKLSSGMWKVDAFTLEDSGTC
jgi:hypothetical protein